MNGTESTFARDRATSITGLPQVPHSYIAPPNHLTNPSPQESVSGRLAFSPEQPTTKISEKDSPKPHPQIEYSSTNGSNPKSSDSPSEFVPPERQTGLDGQQSRRQEYESMGSIRQSHHNFHPPKLVLDQNRHIPTRFPRSVWDHRPISTPHFYLAYCLDCRAYVIMTN